MRYSRPRRWLATVGATAALIPAIAACSQSVTGTVDTPHPADSSSTPSIDVASLRAELPERIRDSGVLIVGTSAPFSPMELNKDGKLSGFDVDLVNAVAQTLGLRADIRQRPFPSLISDVENGSVDMAARGLFDTKQREEKVDMVTYFRAGTQWAAHTPADVDPNNACGKRVGAESATTQLTLELPAKSRACEVVGEPKIDIVEYDSEQKAMESLARHEVDAVSADSPVVLYAAQQSGGRIKPVGHAFDTLPYSFPVTKGSPLGPVLQKTVQQLIDTGELTKLAERWGIQRGVIHKSTINAAIN